MSSSTRKSSRNTTRIDYNLLNSTGERTTKESPIEKSPITESPHEESLFQEFPHNISPTSINDTNLSAIMPSKSEKEATLLVQEVEDLIDENPISPDTIPDVDATVTQLINLRSSLRSHNFFNSKQNTSIKN